MSEIALYRKYRPEKFSDVVGQDHIVTVLQGAIKNNTITHAYLFSGSRGTGKTSVARVFAKVLGCGDQDIYEIDAASNRGIDEIRELREAVHTLPFNSPYKTYIIDEVHMMTTPAFNALLKTLEEPPQHVIFILATTEFHKLPETIISRCQSFNFKQASDEDVKKVIEGIAQSESYKLDKESLNLIALLGEGSYRDAIGTLQKVMTISDDKKLTIDEVEKITGAPRTETINELLEEIVEGDLGDVLEEVEKAASLGIDMKILTKMILRHLRFLMLLTYAPDLEKKIAKEISEKEMEFLKELTKEEKKVSLPAVLKELLLAYNEIGRSYIKQLPIELAFVKILGKPNEK